MPPQPTLSSAGNGTRLDPGNARRGKAAAGAHADIATQVGMEGSPGPRSSLTAGSKRGPRATPVPPVPQLRCRPTDRTMPGSARRRPLQPAPRRHALSSQHRTGNATQPSTARHRATQPAPRRHADRSPGRIGRFEVRRFLGEGAFGRVYEAYDPQSEARACALKVAKPERLTSPDSVQRFCARPRPPPNCATRTSCRVFDAGADGPHYYIACAFIAGHTLEAELLRQHRGRPAGPAPGGSSRCASWPRRCLRPRAGHRPPRRQAGQRDAGRAGRAAADGLRPGARGRGRGAADAGGHGAGHAGVHGAGAGRGQGRARSAPAATSTASAACCTSC